MIWLLFSLVAVVLFVGIGLIATEPRRLYKSGTGWCFWRWTDTPSGYITRLHVVKTPWFAICLHWIHGPDREKCLHDHPVSFLSIVLRGGYCEIRETSEDGIEPYRRIVNRKWFNFIRASIDDRHKILLAHTDTLTLCFMGPKTREWGFHTPDGWIHWKQYNDEKYRPLSDLILREHYSKEAVERIAEQKASRIALVNEHLMRGELAIPDNFSQRLDELERELDENAPDNRAYVLDRESFGRACRETVQPIDFDDEAPTQPRAYGEGDFGAGSFGEKK